MSRLRKIVQIGLLWSIVSLIAVDPVAACRLLARRCCVCCCHTCCHSCDCSEKQPGDASPSDAPVPPTETTLIIEIPPVEPAVSSPSGPHAAASAEPATGNRPAAAAPPSPTA